MPNSEDEVVSELEVCHIRNMTNLGMIISYFWSFFFLSQLAVNADSKGSYLNSRRDVNRKGKFSK